MGKKIGFTHGCIYDLQMHVLPLPLCCSHICIESTLFCLHLHRVCSILFTFVQNLLYFVHICTESPLFCLHLHRISSILFTFAQNLLYFVYICTESPLFCSHLHRISSILFTFVQNLLYFFPRGCNVLLPYMST